MQVKIIVRRDLYIAYLNNYHLKGSIKRQKSKLTLSGRSPQEKKGGHESEVRGETIGTTGRGTLIKIITFQTKSNVGNDTVFTP